MRLFIPDDQGWPNLKSVITHHEFHGRTNGAHKVVSMEITPASSSIVLLGRDPARHVYRMMIKIALDNIFAFSLVWRDDATYSCLAHSLLEQLRPHLCHERHTNEWRGTELLRSKAWVRWFRVTEESLFLISEPESLFAWAGPKLPEDLAFYNENGRGWLGSTAHEHLGWLDLTALDPQISNEFLTLLNAPEPHA